MILFKATAYIWTLFHFFSRRENSLLKEIVAYLWRKESSMIKIAAVLLFRSLYSPVLATCVAYVQHSVCPEEKVLCFPGNAKAYCRCLLLFCHSTHFRLCFPRTGHLVSSKTKLIVWDPPFAEGRLRVCKCLLLKRFLFHFMLSMWTLL